MGPWRWVPGPGNVGEALWEERLSPWELLLILCECKALAWEELGLSEGSVGWRMPPQVRDALCSDNRGRAC